MLKVWLHSLPLFLSKSPNVPGQTQVFTLRLCLNMQ